MQYLNARQINEWRTFYNLEPWGYHEEDLQQSFTRHAVATAMGGSKKKNGEAITIDDYSLEAMRNKQKEGPAIQSGDDILGFFTAFNKNVAEQTTPHNNPPRRLKNAKSD